MRFKKIIIFLLSLSAFSSNACGLCYEDDDIKDILKSHGAEGTVVISSLSNENNYIYNSVRANIRVSPASTFKIANSLIAIDSHVLRNQHEKIKWDGEKRFLDSWNKDQNLQSAFKSSCVWFYQKIASKVRKNKYKNYLQDFNYGNKKLGSNITTFWLEGGDLKISPIEQIDFLKSVYRKEFSVSKKSYEALKNIMLEECTGDYKIYSKTGAATKNWKGHGWYVGYVKTKKDTFFFATNIDINGFSDLEKRKKITIDVLKKKNLL